MELIDALHLRGWRPLALAVLVAAGALVGAMIPQDTTYTSRHIVFAAQLASDDLSPAQLEDFADELRLAATLPQVSDAVEEALGSGPAAEYTVEISETASDTSLAFIAEAGSEPVAREASRLTAEKTAEFVIGQSIVRADSLVAALEAQLTAVREEQETLTDLAGGISPNIALTRASELLFDTRQAAATGDAEAEQLADSLEEEIELLRPHQQQYDLLEEEAAEIADELGVAITDRSRSENSLANASSELVIAEVATRETSKAPAIAQNMLLLAAINGLVLIAAFVLIDLFADRRRNDDPRVVASGSSDDVLDLDDLDEDDEDDSWSDDETIVFDDESSSDTDDATADDTADGSTDDTGSSRVLRSR